MNEPQPADAVQQDGPTLQPNCSRLRSEDIEIFHSRPIYVGAFADVWEGSLAGARVAIKSYRFYSMVDDGDAEAVYHTRTCVVRFRRYL